MGKQSGGAVCPLKKADRLADKLRLASESYYNGESVISDAKFDRMRKKLQELDPNHPFLSEVGAPSGKQKHLIPMGSLSNTHNLEEAQAWYKRLRKSSRGDFEFVCSDKLDGCSISLLYHNGGFVRATTRGDGTQGEDVTANAVKAMEAGAFPKTIKEKGTVSIRAECMIPINVFQKQRIFAESSNPRNAANGTVLRHDGRGSEFLKFVAFDYLPLRDEEPLPDWDYVPTFSKALFHLEYNKFTVPKYQIVMSVSDALEFVQSRLEVRDSLPFEIDGVVLRVNDNVWHRDLGIVSKRPVGSTAWKFPPRGEQTTLKDVGWSVGHTGIVTPVAELEPVEIGGVTVTYASLCNLDEISRLGVSINDRVEVVRAGDVIPKVTGLSAKSKKPIEIKPPEKCPSCDTTLRFDGARLRCTFEECPEKIYQGILHWIKVLDIKELGPEILGTAFDTYVVENITDLYTTANRIESWESLGTKNGFVGTKRAEKIVAEIEKSRNAPLAKVLAGIGIGGVGVESAKKLVKALSLAKVCDLKKKVGQVSQLPGFGKKREKLIRRSLKEKGPMMEKLDLIFTFQQPVEKVAKSGPLEGEVVCFTGDAGVDRKRLFALTEESGGEYATSLTKAVTMLVAADPESTTTKMRKAKERGVRVLLPSDFLELIDWDGSL